MSRSKTKILQRIKDMSDDEPIQKGLLLDILEELVYDVATLEAEGRSNRLRQKRGEI